MYGVVFGYNNSKEPNCLPTYTMKFCRVCKLEVPDHLMPRQTVSILCRHSVLICSECTCKSIRKNGRCPYPGCNEKHSIKTKGWETPVPLDIEMMTGMNMKTTVTLNDTVIHMKGLIREATNIIEEGQKLLCNNSELVDMLPDGTIARLGDYNVSANNKILLVKIMLNIPRHLDSSVFDLCWGFPASGTDYLDATCLLFAGNEHVAVVDFRNKSYDNAIKHSGDIVDFGKETGHHTIEVNLKKLPENITHLFFILSAWVSATIAPFRKPNLRFYDIKTPEIDLCNTNFTHAMNSEAVIMCSLSQTKGRWQIFESGKLSNGNANNYEPLVESVLALIESGV